MDNANGQYAYHHTNEHGNAILHGSFDQERHGTGNGSAPNPLHTTPYGTRPPPTQAEMTFLQGVVTNVDRQMLAAPYNQGSRRKISFLFYILFYRKFTVKQKRSNVNLHT